MNHTVEPAFGVREIAAYVAGAQSASGTDRPVRLASNEAALGPSPKVVEVLRQLSAKADRYPDPACAELRSAIGDAYELAKDNIICGAGSEALIHIAMRSYVSRGDEVIISARAFSVGKIAALSCGATPVFVREKENLDTDIDGMLAAVTPHTKFVYLPNCNNPTGALVGRSEILRLRNGLPKSVLLFLDGAYREYIDDPDFSPGDDLVGTDRGNTIVCATFSKAYALAGLRVGWLHAAADVIDILNRVRPAFGVSLPAQAAAIAALSDRQHREKEIAVVREQRARMIAAFKDLGYGVGHAPANFVPVHIPAGWGTAAELNLFLMQRGILVRPVANYDLPQMLRVTVGNACDTGRAIDGFATFFKSLRLER